MMHMYSHPLFHSEASQAYHRKFCFQHLIERNEQYEVNGLNQIVVYLNRVRILGFLSEHNQQELEHHLESLVDLLEWYRLHLDFFANNHPY